MPTPAEAIMWRNRFLMLLDRVSEPIAICEGDGTVRVANSAMAALWDTVPGKLRGQSILSLFRPRDRAQLGRVVEALRLRRRSRYPVAVSWTAADGTLRHGELSADPVSDRVEDEPSLLVQLRVFDSSPAPEPPPVAPVEARLLALLAGGATTDRAARALGLTRDGANYHLRRLSARWGAANRTELVARAYALGLLAPGVWPPEAVEGAVEAAPARQS